MFRSFFLLFALKRSIKNDGILNLASNQPRFTKSLSQATWERETKAVKRNAPKKKHFTFTFEGAFCSNRLLQAGNLNQMFKPNTLKAHETQWLWNA